MRFWIILHGLEKCIALLVEEQLLLTDTSYSVVLGIAEQLPMQSAHSLQGLYFLLVVTGNILEFLWKYLALPPEHKMPGL
jgi:hypothetical protein